MIDRNRVREHLKSRIADHHRNIKKSAALAEWVDKATQEDLDLLCPLMGLVFYDDEESSRRPSIIGDQF